MSNTASFSAEAKIIEGTATQIADRVVATEDDTVTQYLDDQISVPASSTDLSISLASVSSSAKYLLVDFSAACSVKLNGTGNSAISIGTGGGSFVFINGTITSMHVTNAGSTAIIVKRVAAA